MAVKEEVRKIGADFFSGLRFGLGGFPNICPTPGRKIRSKGKGRGLARGRGRGPLGVPSRRRDFGIGFGDFSNL